MLLKSGVTSPQGVVEAKVTWGDKGREGVKKSEIWGDVIMDGPLPAYLL